MIEAHVSSHSIPRVIGTVHIRGALHITDAGQFLAELDEELSYLREEMLAEWRDARERNASVR